MVRRAPRASVECDDVSPLAALHHVGLRRCRMPSTVTAGRAFSPRRPSLPLSGRAAASDQPRCRPLADGPERARDLARRSPDIRGHAPPPTPQMRLQACRTFVRSSRIHWQVLTFQDACAPFEAGGGNGAPMRLHFTFSFESTIIDSRRLLHCASRVLPCSPSRAATRCSRCWNCPRSRPPTPSQDSILSEDHHGGTHRRSLVSGTSSGTRPSAIGCWCSTSSMAATSSL